MRTTPHCAHTGPRLKTPNQDNGSGTLAPLVRKGYITLYDWPSKDGFISQAAQLQHCFNRSGGASAKAEWLTNHDIDEFPVVLAAEPRVEYMLYKEAFPLHIMLDEWKREKIGAIVLDRMNFGTSGHETPVRDDLVIRSFTEREVHRKWGWRYTRQRNQGKVFQLWEAQRIGGSPAHVANVEPTSGYTENTADGELFNRSHARGALWEPLRLNHYSSRSFAECMAKLDPKINRQSESTNWRTKNGAILCERRHPRSARYTVATNADNYDLAASPFPTVVERLVRMTTEL